MIIKDKPFHIPACQPMSCAFYYPAGVFLHEVAISESSSCTQGLVRRWPGFVKLEAYQVRLSRLLSKRWGYVRGERELKEINGSFAIFPEWDSDVFDFRDAGVDFDDPDGDGLMHSGGVL